jgi:hypothetical protein
VPPSSPQAPAAKEEEGREIAECAPAGAAQFVGGVRISSPKEETPCWVTSDLLVFSDYICSFCFIFFAIFHEDKKQPHRVFLVFIRDSFGIFHEILCKKLKS